MTPRFIKNRKRFTFEPGTIPATALVGLFSFLLLHIATPSSAQVLTNENAAISITGGAVLKGDTVNNAAGEIQNDGTIELDGHYLNSGLTRGDGNYDIRGNWNNSGTFQPGFSTVQLYGLAAQMISNSGTGSFYNLVINNSGTFP